MPYEEGIDLVTSTMAEEVAALMTQLEMGLPVSLWHQEMMTLLARYHTAAMMSGLGLDILPEGALRLLGETLEFHEGFLDNFKRVIEAAGEFKNKWRARARLYAMSPTTSYAEGDVYRQTGKFLPLPAMPAQGTNCYTNCKCRWRIEKRGPGDYDAYWVLEPGAKHCQVCLQRRDDWYPIRIRGGRLRVKSAFSANGHVLKHLGGKHDQSTHGRGIGGADRKYPKAGDRVDGRKVIDRDNVPNTASIGATLDEYTTLLGIREMSMSDFNGNMFDLFYSKTDIDQSKRLARAITSNKKISPLIVVDEKGGPYVLEGVHRLGALDHIGAKSFPALVVINKERPPDWWLPKASIKHLSGKHDQQSHGRGSGATAAAMADAVNDYLGGTVRASGLNVLDPVDFDRRFAGEYEDLHGGIAAIRTGKGIFIKKGYESDGVHELVHQSGALEKGVGAFVNEGVTQSATKRIGQQASIDVRDTYDRETAFVEKYILPTVGLKPKAFFRGYIGAENKSAYITDLVWKKYGDRFSSVEEWGKNPRQSFLRGIDEMIGTHIHLMYLVDEVGV